MFWELKFNNGSDDHLDNNDELFEDIFKDFYHFLLLFQETLNPVEVSTPADPASDFEQTPVRLCNLQSSIKKYSFFIFSVQSDFFKVS